MASNIVIEAEVRSSTGKGATGRLRRINDHVPGVVYGADRDPQNFSLEYRQLAKAMQDEAFFSQIMDLKIDGNQDQVIVRDLQRHPATDRVMHVDFLRVRQDRTIQVAVPLRFLNEDTCVGVKAGGGLIAHNLIEVEITCLPQDLPEFIEVDMANVKVGQATHLSDLDLPEGVQIVALSLGEDHDTPVVSVQIPRGGLLDEAERGDEDVGEEIPDESDNKGPRDS